MVCDRLLPVNFIKGSWSWNYLEKYFGLIFIFNFKNVIKVEKNMWRKNARAQTNIILLAGEICLNLALTTASITKY